MNPLPERIPSVRPPRAELPSVLREGIFFAGSLLTVLLFWNTPLLTPLRLFVVLLHELGHGLAAILTGGHLERIVLEPGEGGHAITRGGSAFWTLSAGYLGSLLFGVGILRLARVRRVDLVLMAMGALVLFLTLGYVRSWFGFGFGLLFGLFTLGGGRFLPRWGSAAFLMVVGLTSCLYALWDIKSDVLDRPELQSDARMLAELTLIPTVVWGGLWIGISLGVAGWMFHRTWKRLRTPPVQL